MFAVCMYLPNSSTGGGLCQLRAHSHRDPFAKIWPLQSRGAPSAVCLSRSQVYGAVFRCTEKEMQNYIVD